MKKLYLLALIALSLCLGSCRTYLTPAILGHNVGYMPKPLTSDSVHSKTYLSAVYGASASSGKSIEFEMGMINMSRGHTYKFLNFSYGLMGYLGTAKYNDPGDPLTNDPADPPELPNFKKTAGGLGIKTSIGFHDVSTSGHTDYRILNWENSISTELGPYTSYRKYLTNGAYKNTYISKMKTVWTTGISSEIAWHPQLNKDFTHAFRLFLGWTPKLIKSFDTDLSTTVFANYSESKPKDRVGFAYNYFLQYKKIHFNFEVASNVNFASNLSIGYSF